MHELIAILCLCAFQDQSPKAERLLVGESLVVPEDLETSLLVEGKTRGWQWGKSEERRVWIPTLPGEYRIYSPPDEVRPAFDKTIEALSRVPKGARATVQSLRSPLDVQTLKSRWLWVIPILFILGIGTAVARTLLSLRSERSEVPLNKPTLYEISALPRILNSDRREVCHRIHRWLLSQSSNSRSQEIVEKLEVLLEPARFSKRYPTERDVEEIMELAHLAIVPRDSIERPNTNETCEGAPDAR